MQKKIMQTAIPVFYKTVIFSRLHNFISKNLCNMITAHFLPGIRQATDPPFSRSSARRPPDDLPSDTRHSADPLYC